MQREMDASISALCGSLSEVLTHADDSSRALSDALSRRAIPLGTASDRSRRRPHARVPPAPPSFSQDAVILFGRVGDERVPAGAGPAGGGGGRRPGAPRVHG